MYFLGGSPRHLVDTLADSPAWATIRARHAAGAVLAGCSAGAMAFGGWTLQPRRLWSTATAGATWYPALGLVPWLAELPHFDRWLARVGPQTKAGLAASVPADVTLIGVDEDTALVDLDGTFRLLGRQGVSVIDAARGEVRHATGALLALGGGH